MPCLSVWVGCRIFTWHTIVSPILTARHSQMLRLASTVSRGYSGTTTTSRLLSASIQVRILHLHNFIRKDHNASIERPLACIIRIWGLLLIVWIMCSCFIPSILCLFPHRIASNLSPFSTFLPIFIPIEPFQWKQSPTLRWSVISVRYSSRFDGCWNLQFSTDSM